MGMNVVHSGNTFQIYGDALKTYDKLPAGTYEVGFNKFSGFFLVAHSDLEVNEEKVYGCSEQKVQKVLKSFSKVERNFGVILSGRSISDNSHKIPSMKIIPYQSTKHKTLSFLSRHNFTSYT